MRGGASERLRGDAGTRRALIAGVGRGSHAAGGTDLSLGGLDSHSDRDEGPRARCRPYAEAVFNTRRYCRRIPGA
eukprot:14672536-Alexandrium_andersonii.AAC.1